MGKRQLTGNDRARSVLAQEAARIIVEQGIDDYRIAKIKAAERMGLSNRGSLPGNREIEAAVGEHLKLFGRETHVDLLQSMRRAALSAMEILAAFSPRLVGPVLNGTAAANSPVNLHETAALYYSLVAVLLGAQFLAIGFVAEMIAALVWQDRDAYSIGEQTAPRESSTALSGPHMRAQRDPSRLGRTEGADS